LWYNIEMNLLGKAGNSEMRITEELVQYAANLSQIQLDERQSARMTEELGKLFGYLDVLNEADTEGIEPLAYVGPATNVMRPDVVTGSYDRAVLLANAPERTEEAFQVPKIVG